MQKTTRKYGDYYITVETAPHPSGGFSPVLTIEREAIVAAAEVVFPRQRIEGGASATEDLAVFVGMDAAVQWINASRNATK